MRDKGSDLRSTAEKAELLRTLNEFTEKLETDPYQPGVIHPGLCGDDLQDIVEDVIWVRDFSEMTIRVTREANGSYISAEVIDRKK
jgi:hypothetical protein